MNMSLLVTSPPVLRFANVVSVSTIISPPRERELRRNKFVAKYAVLLVNLEPIFMSALAAALPTLVVPSTFTLPPTSTDTGSFSKTFSVVPTRLDPIHILDVLSEPVTYKDDTYTVDVVTSDDDTNKSSFT